MGEHPFHYDIRSTIAVYINRRNVQIGLRGEESDCGVFSCGDVQIDPEQVGSGIVPAYAAGRQFRDMLGGLNQQVAAIADEMILMIAGLPLPIKGWIEGLQ